MKVAKDHIVDWDKAYIVGVGGAYKPEAETIGEIGECKFDAGGKIGEMRKLDKAAASANVSMTLGKVC